MYTNLLSFPKNNVLTALQKVASILCIVFSLLLLLPADTINAFGYSANQTSPPLSLEDRILRLHIRAAGDDTASQEIKLHVRDAVLSVIQESTKTATTAKEAEEALLPLLDDITAVANNVLESYGVSYRANTQITTEFFPIKQYGSLLLPPGQYRALRIELGEGEGKNWWCMLYPSLCLTEGITATLPEEEKEELRGLLTEEEFDTLFATEETKPIFCFKLGDFFKKLKKWF